MTADRSVYSDVSRFAEDTRRRFLTEIVARVPLDRLVEVHLFTPIRQSGVETGVAIVAARPVEPAAEVPEAGEPPPLGAEPTDTDATPEALLDAPADAPADSPADAAMCDPTEDAAGDGAEQPSENGSALDDESAALVEDLDIVTPLPLRHTIFTARYRLTIKGADRGKWSVDVVEEADAPLATVEAVVRGVQRRAGDAADPDRLVAEGVARLLGATPPAQ